MKAVVYEGTRRVGVREVTDASTVIHELEGAPQTAALVAGEMESQGAGGGWNEVLSGLKTLLETGKPLQG